jgi:hypothetical protein
MSVAVGRSTTKIPLADVPNRNANSPAPREPPATLTNPKPN